MKSMISEEVNIEFEKSEKYTQHLVDGEKIEDENIDVSFDWNNHCVFESYEKGDGERNQEIE